MTSQGQDASRRLQPTVPVRQLLSRPELGLRVVAGRPGLDRAISDAEVQKPGLVFAGMQPAHPRSVQVLGRAETEYLANRGTSTQRQLILEYVRAGAPCLVVARGIEPSPAMKQVSESEGIPLLATGQATGDFMRALHAFLDQALAPHIDVHGVLVQVHSVGVLIVGPSGIGKSETALELMLRGHRLVADDRVCLSRLGDALVGQGKAPLGHYMEIRGLGVLHAGDLFGQASVVDQAAVNLIVELADWRELVSVDRTGLEERRRSYLTVELPCVVVPVRPGRHMATIVEVAARNQILRARGVHGALRYDGDLRKLLGERGEVVGE